ncbi:hypothetical protein SAMN06313486_10124 [Epsilonproteobacteria bacterium SCGC AD-308-P11]|nr:hypothetical protein SAMN06313486_10124 [Epsilonproteobacteria bacterium SCGC AD-308-P11]
MKQITIKIAKVKHRVTWAFNPVTRVVKSKKAYDRNQYKIDKYF